MRRTVAAVVGGIALVALIGVAVSARGEGRGVVQSNPNGRYQVINGTPEMTRNIMLLDSWTGATWIICSEGKDQDAEARWCYMGEHRLIH